MYVREREQTLLDKFLDCIWWYDNDSDDKDDDYDDNTIDDDDDDIKNDDDDDDIKNDDEADKTWWCYVI